jgi:hypothetical protein
MTKWGGFSLKARGHHIPNFHLVMGDDDVIDEPFHQLSALGKGQLFQGGLQPPAKGLEALGQRGDIHLWLRLRLELAQLLGQAVVGLGHLLSCALERVTPDDLRQVDLQQASLLPIERREGVTQGLPSGLQGLGQPFAALGPRERMGDQRWLGQAPADILPHPCVQGSSRGKARRATSAPSRPQHLAPTATDVGGIARGDGAPRTRQLTRATTDQAPEPGLVGGVVPAGHLGVPIQPGWGRRKGLRAHDGRHGDGDPLFGWGRPMTVPRPHGAQGGLADAGGHRAGAFAVGRARIHRRAEDAPHRGDMPARPPAWRRDLVVGEALGDAIQAGWCVRVGSPMQRSG